MSLTPTQANDLEEAFISSVRSNELIWLLMLEGGFANWREEDDVIVPLWHSEAEASACAINNFPGYEPVSFTLAEFLQELAPQLSEQSIWVAVQPTENLAGNQMPVELLAGRLEVHHA